MSLESVLPDEMQTELEAAEGAGPTGKESLRSRAIRSSAWTMANYGGNTVLRLGGNLVLTRLLFPQIFGISAIINIFIQGLHMFTDIGVGMSVIQNPRGDEPDFLNTAWTIQSMRGFSLWICSMLIAYPVSLFYAHGSVNPHLMYELRWLIPAAAATAAIDGLISTKYHLRNRHLTLAGSTTLDLGCYGLNLVIMVAWAYFSPTVWALIGGSVISSLVHMMLTHLALPGASNRPRWDRESARSLFKFGRWIFVSTLLTFLAGQCDRLMFGKKIPLELLGVYSIALTLASMPKEAIIRIAGPITFSVYSRLGTSRAAVASAFAKVRGPLLVFGAWGISGLIVLGPSIVHVMYDRRYAEAGWILQVLAVSAWFEILETTNGSALLALGLPRWIAVANASKFATMIVLIPVGFYVHGFTGALAGVVLSEMVRFAVSAVGVIYERIGNATRDLAVTAMLGATAGMGWCAERWMENRWGHPILAALAAAAAVSLPWAPLALVAVRSLRHDDESKVPMPAIA